MSVRALMKSVHPGLSRDAADQTDPAGLLVGICETYPARVLDVHAHCAGLQHRSDGLSEQPVVERAVRTRIPGFDIRRDRETRRRGDPAERVERQTRRHVAAVGVPQAPGDGRTRGGNGPRPGLLHEPGRCGIPHVHEHQRNSTARVHVTEGVSLGGLGQCVLGLE